MANDSFYVTSYTPSPTADSFYITSYTPAPPADSFYVFSATTTSTSSHFHRVEAILGVSSDFIAAWNDDTVYAKAKAIIEFGNNRFNDNAVITASSTKTVDRITPFDNATFWKAEDAFNNKDRQTVNWMVCDQGITADAGYRVVDINNTTAEKGWWSANKSNGSGVFASPEWVMSTFDARYINEVRLFLMEGYSNMSNVTVQYYNATTSAWVDVATNFTLSPITYDYTWPITTALVSGLRVYVNNTLSINDYARISELQGLLVLDVSEQIVSCDVEFVREEYEGTVPIGTTRSNTFNLELENIDQILSPDNTDESIYAQYMNQDNRVEIYYGIKTGEFGPTSGGDLTPPLADWYAYDDANSTASVVGDEVWITALNTSSSSTIIVGLTPPLNWNSDLIAVTPGQNLTFEYTLTSTGMSGSMAAQAAWYVLDASDNIVTLQLGTSGAFANGVPSTFSLSASIPVGGAKIAPAMAWAGDAPASGVYVKLSDISLTDDDAVDIPGGSSYEYVQMGEFWTDEWQVDGGALTARTSGRDFSKFLQDDRITIGRVWQNETVGTVFKDIMQLMGFGVSRIDIDPDATRTFDITYIKDESIWSFMSQLAFADQGLFGFGRDGRFYYHSYNRLNKSPFYNISYDYDESTNIIDGQFTTAIYTNKVTVNVTPVNLENTGRRSIWGAEDPTILSWNTLASSMTNSQTTVSLVHTANDPNDLQYYLPEKNGYVYIDSELIKYELRSGTTLTGCVRGHSGTAKTTHTAGAYIGEARLWDIEYDNYPALNVQSPYITAIDGRLNESLSPIATLVIWQQDAFTAKLVIANAVAAMTVLEGTGPAIDQPDSELPWTTVIAGQVPIEEAGREKIGINAEDSPENAAAIRKYGKNQIDIDNKWVQDKNHGLELAENIITEYAVPRKIVEFNVFPYPALDLGLRVYVANYSQLSIHNKEYHLIGLHYRFDGGLECQATLRETLASSNHRSVKEYNVDALVSVFVPPADEFPEFAGHSATGTNSVLSSYTGPIPGTPATPGDLYLAWIAFREDSISVDIGNVPGWISTAGNLVYRIVTGDDPAPVFTILSGTPSGADMVTAHYRKTHATNSVTNYGGGGYGTNVTSILWNGGISSTYDKSLDIAFYNQFTGSSTSLSINQGFTERYDSTTSTSFATGFSDKQLPTATYPSDVGSSNFPTITSSAAAHWSVSGIIIRGSRYMGTNITVPTDWIVCNSGSGIYTMGYAGNVITGVGHGTLNGFAGVQLGWSTNDPQGALDTSTAIPAVAGQRVEASALIESTQSLTSSFVSLQAYDSSGNALGYLVGNGATMFANEEYTVGASLDCPVDTAWVAALIGFSGDDSTGNFVTFTNPYLAVI